jgi:hypothetical protein
MTTLDLSQDEIETLADIRMRLIQIAGPLLWPELLLAIVDDHLERLGWDDPPPPRLANELPGWLLSQRRQLEALDTQPPIHRIHADG